MRFLVDECTGPRVANWLRANAHEVFSVYDEARGMTDDEVLAKAYSEHRILITNDATLRSVRRFKTVSAEFEPPLPPSPMPMSAETTYKSGGAYLPSPGWNHNWNRPSGIASQRGLKSSLVKLNSPRTTGGLAVSRSSRSTRESGKYRAVSPVKDMSSSWAIDTGFTIANPQLPFVQGSTRRRLSTVGRTRPGERLPGSSQILESSFGKLNGAANTLARTSNRNASPSATPSKRPPRRNKNRKKRKPVEGEIINRPGSPRIPKKENASLAAGVLRAPPTRRLATS